ncbi:MAG: type II toxin-antitoxin system HicA family toxin [bacterium]|nr:type II toxin-antitoxin system HicA family toxin [bacterium]
MPDKKITPVRYQLLIKLFELDGFTVKRTRGDHIMMTKPGIKRPLVIKTSPRKVPVTHIRTNMTTAGMSRERYFELLEQVG